MLVLDFILPFTVVAEAVRMRLGRLRQGHNCTLPKGVKKFFTFIFLLSGWAVPDVRGSML